MPTIVKILIAVAIVAYIGGGVGVWLTWLRAYQDTNKDVDPLFVKMMLIGFIGLWVIFLVVIFYVNRRDEIVRFINKIAKK